MLKTLGPEGMSDHQVLFLASGLVVLESSDFTRGS